MAAIRSRQPRSRPRMPSPRPVLVLFGIGLVALLLIALVPRSIAPPTRVAGPGAPYMGLPPAHVVPTTSAAIPGFEKGYGRFLAARVGKIAEIKTGRGPVLQVVFSTDSLSALSSAEDGTISLWDLQTGEETRQYLGHTGPPRRLAVAGNLIISSGTTDHTVRLWDFDSAEQLHCFSLGSYCEPMAISPDGAQVLFAANVDDPYIASTQSFKEVQLDRGNGGEGIYAVAWSPSGRMFATGGWGGVVRVYDAATQQEIFRLSLPDLVFCLAFTPDDRKLLAGDRGKHVHVIGTTRRGVLRQFDVGGCRSIAVTPDSRYALAPNGEDKLFFWDLETGKPSDRFEGKQNPATAVDISRDGNLALSGDQDGTIRLWRLPAPATVRQARSAPTVVSESPLEQLPSTEAVQSAQSIVKEVFRGDYRWFNPATREALFQKVQMQASDPRNEPAVQYAVLLETANIATSAGDADLVIWVSGELAQRYPRTSPEVRLQILNRAADREAITAKAERQLGEELIRLADDAASTGDVATALRAAQRAESMLSTPYATAKVAALRGIAARER
jgi:hypothetical protein